MNITTYKYLCLILLLVSGLAFANDAPLVMGRNDEVINVQSTNISMREEEIIITLRKDYYEVDVTFFFFNSGAEERVQLGFPVESFQHDIYDNDVYDFKSYINGRMLPRYMTKTDTINRHDKYVKWFIRDVTFPANAITVSRVTYKSQYNFEGMYGYLNAGYIYGTGRFWNGAIEKMTVIINHGDDILIDYVQFGDIHASEFKWEADGRYRYVFENVEPKSTFDDEIHINVYRFDIHGKYNEQFGITFGSFPSRTKGREDIREKAVDPEMGWCWNELLLYRDPMEIRHYTKNQLRLFINFFYALRGYDFQNPLYRDYFRRLESFGDRNNSRYRVNPNFSERDFNEIERKNIDYLRRLERMIPP